MPYSACDENRLRIAKEAEEKFNLARKLVPAGEYAKALECYLFAFDHSRMVNGWGGVRLSYIPSEIAQLGGLYPPALEALRQRRDDREKLILEGETDYDVLAEWTSINQYLGENERELELLDRLKLAGTLGEPLKEKIIASNFEKLLEDKRYDLVCDYLNDHGRYFFMDVVEYERAQLFPRKATAVGIKQEQLLKLSEESVKENGAKVYEIALAAKREDVADEIQRRVLEYFNDSDAFSGFLKAAVRMGDKKKVAHLKKLAKSALSAVEFGKLVNY